MFYIFTESVEGKLGYVGRGYFSEVQAENKADDYDCITHIIQADSLVKAKRRLRDKMVKKEKDMSMLYKNVKNQMGGLKNER